jgi:hypothetical protein
MHYWTGIIAGKRKRLKGCNAISAALPFFQASIAGVYRPWTMIPLFPP